MRTLKRLLLTVSMCCLVATANAAPIDDGIAAYDRGDYAQALDLYRPLAIQGNAEAQHHLGYMYSTGLGVTQNNQEALKWLRLAAAQGNAVAQFHIGRMYYRGDGVTQNYQEALKWVRLAATQGHETAQHAIGMAYYKGEGVTQNYQEALKWYRLAAAQGRVSAIEDLKRPEMVAAARNSTPDRRSTNIKTGTKQEEQVSIKTNRKTEQTRRTTNRTETPDRTSPPKLVFNSSTPKADGTVELSGRVISDASISEILINGRALEVSLGRDTLLRLPAFHQWALLQVTG